MRHALNIAVAPLLLCLAWAPMAHAQHDHGHGAVPAASAGSTADVAPAQRWQADAPLRKGMAGIRAAVDGLQHYEHGHMGPDQAVTLATQVQEQIAYLVANCRLEPQADAALHLIIARLGGSAQALKDDPADLSSIAPMRDALQDYSRQFADPVATSAEAAPMN